MIISGFPIQDNRLRLGEKIPKRCLVPLDTDSALLPQTNIKQNK